VAARTARSASIEAAPTSSKAITMKRRQIAARRSRNRVSAALAATSASPRRIAFCNNELATQESIGTGKGSHPVDERSSKGIATGEPSNRSVIVFSMEDLSYKNDSLMATKCKRLFAFLSIYCEENSCALWCHPPVNKLSAVRLLAAPGLLCLCCPRGGGRRA
jgi:hypothetical protein